MFEIQLRAKLLHKFFIGLGFIDDLSPLFEVKEYSFLVTQLFHLQENPLRELNHCTESV